MQIFFRCITALCAAILFVAYIGGRDVSTLPHAAGAVTFLDRSGVPLGTILGSDSAHTVTVPLDRIAPAFSQAVIAAEDARFYAHGAIDIRGLLRAADEYFRYGEFRSGGSTITMQLARLVHPTPSSLRGKFVQIMISERLAMRSEKPALLEAYLNRAPMGGNLYGAEAAARTYFGTPASDLDLAQASLLAALPNDPVNLAPDVHLAAARARQRYILHRMHALGMITTADSARASNETLAVARHDSGIAAAAHALFYLYPAVSGAERVRTTIDAGLQRFVETQVGDVIGALASRHVSDAAVLVIDNATGAVLTYVGSPDYFSDAALGRNDGVQALRQPGSSLKPFTYELALERGAITSTSILPDVPSTFAISAGKLYTPADYSGSFAGPVRVRYALANSLNVPAVRVLSALGPSILLARLRELGFSHLDKPASYYGLGLTLGGGEVSLWENVQAYVAMARGGEMIPLHLIAGTQTDRRVGDAATWALVTDMLADRHVRIHSFGAHSVLDMPFDAAVKTGTSSDFRDTWTVGFSRDYTVGVWVGNFDGSAMRGISGVTGAGPLWNRIMLHLHESHEPKRFAPPPGYTRAPICATTGHAPSNACPAVVTEWVRDARLAAVRKPARAGLGPAYDAWLALQPQTERSGSLRIVAPADGAIFYRNDAASELQAKEQQLALRATGAVAPVHWSVNGHPIALDAEGHAFVPVTLGSLAIVASDGERTDRVTIRVVPQPRALRPGFTVRAKNVPRY